MLRVTNICWKVTNICWGPTYVGDMLRGHQHDELPEGAFYMVGGIDEVVEKAKSMQD